MSATPTGKPPREHLARAHGTQLRLPVTAATEPEPEHERERERVLPALLTVHHQHFHANENAPNVKAARGRACAALFGVIAALPAEVLGPEVAVRRRR